MNSQVLITCTLLIMLLLSGCARTEPGTGVSIQFDGTFDTSDGVYMNGSIETSGGASTKQLY